MLRVLFVCRGLEFHGGVERAIEQFARHRPEGVHVRIASLERPSEEMVASLTRFDVPVHHVEHGGHIRQAIALRQILRHGRADVVVANSFRTYVITKLAVASTARVRVVFWLHGIALVLSGRLRRLVFRTLSKRDALVFVSEAVKFEHLYRGHRGKSTVIYHGVSDVPSDWGSPLTRIEARESFGVPLDSTVLGYTASLTALKDHATLLRALALVKSSLDNVVLLLIGTGPQESNLRELSEELGITNEVYFLGARADARRLLGLLDLYVHPARGEGFGLAVVEAQLAGIPVVVANEGALPELVSNGQSGALFTGGDHHDLAQVITRTLQAPGRSVDLAAKARRDALLRFDPWRFATEFTRFASGALK